jgi:hypothetical protein
MRAIHRHTPPGWGYDPSSWSQRLPIVGLSLVGVAGAGYLAAGAGALSIVWIVGAYALLFGALFLLLARRGLGDRRTVVAA